MHNDGSRSELHERKPLTPCISHTEPVFGAEPLLQKSWGPNKSALLTRARRLPCPPKVSRARIPHGRNSVSLEQHCSDGDHSYTAVKSGSAESLYKDEIAVSVVLICVQNTLFHPTKGITKVFVVHNVNNALQSSAVVLSPASSLQTPAVTTDRFHIVPNCRPQVCRSNSKPHRRHQRRTFTTTTKHESSRKSRSVKSCLRFEPSGYGKQVVISHPFSLLTV